MASPDHIRHPFATAPPPTRVASAKAIATTIVSAGGRSNASKRMERPTSPVAMVEKSRRPIFATIRTFKLTT